MQVEVIEVQVEVIEVEVIGNVPVAAHGIADLVTMRDQLELRIYERVRPVLNELKRIFGEGVCLDEVYGGQGQIHMTVQIPGRGEENLSFPSWLLDIMDAKYVVQYTRALSSEFLS